MRLEILHVPDCPNVALLEARLRQALTELPRPVITRRVVTNTRAAESTGMQGSPTLLIDGADPFARAGSAPSLSCRLYRDEAGALGPAPTLTQLRAAVRDAMAR